MGAEELFEAFGREAGLGGDVNGRFVHAMRSRKLDSEEEATEKEDDQPKNTRLGNPVLGKCKATAKGNHSGDKAEGQKDNHDEEQGKKKKKRSRKNKGSKGPDMDSFTRSRVRPPPMSVSRC